MRTARENIMRAGLPRLMAPSPRKVGRSFELPFLTNRAAIAALANLDLSLTIPNCRLNAAPILRTLEEKLTRSKYCDEISTQLRPRAAIAGRTPRCHKTNAACCNKMRRKTARNVAGASASAGMHPEKRRATIGWRLCEPLMMRKRLADPITRRPTHGAGQRKRRLERRHC